MILDCLDISYHISRFQTFNFSRFSALSGLLKNKTSALVFTYIGYLSTESVNLSSINEKKQAHFLPLNIQKTQKELNHFRISRKIAVSVDSASLCGKLEAFSFMQEI
jgi:hypothetical protein